MNKWEYKYQWETAAAQVENLIDINGKNTYHIQELLKRSMRRILQLQ
jgi:hypothetical protein